MRGLANILFVTATAVTMTACGNDKKDGPTDTLATGSASISVDETYKPVIQQQLQVFDSSYPEARITANYKAESECFKDLFANKARMILVTRGLTKAEKDYCEQEKIVTTSLELVRDAVAVILPPDATDTVFSVEEIKGILTGVNTQKKYTVVFDDQSSSTVRYIADSLLKGGKMGANVFAAKGNDSVVAYVAKNPNAIGFVGLSYVANQDGSTGDNEFVSTVKVAEIWNDVQKRSYKPYQAYIAQRVYPFSRNLYYIKRETHAGLGTGFANFLAGSRGQLIFAHAHLFPLRMNIVIRDASVGQ
jgi:phosphate transport system substrate-binding protein